MRVLILAIVVTLFLTDCNKTPDDVNMFKSRRISKTAKIVLNTTPDKAFLLFGPIEEKKWAHGWNPEVLFPEDAIAEEGMVFKTKAHGHAHDEKEFTWVISKYSKDEMLIVYLVYTQLRAWFITIQCAGTDQGKTKAQITYTYTGLTQEGNKLNEIAMSGMYEQDLKDWEKAINYFLETGKTLVEGH